MSTQSKGNSRFRARLNTTLHSLIPPFESRPSSCQVRDAMGAIQRLRDDGSQFFQGWLKSIGAVA